MKQPILYTVVSTKHTDAVKYAVGPAYQVKRFPGTFHDPGEASQEFKIAVEGDPEYLEEVVFNRTVEKLAARHKLDLAKLADWNSGKKVML